MANRLLDRQVSLLEYLTSGAAIFGDKSSAPAPRPLRGFDSSLLQMEARFSYDKRMKKIAGIFPKTFAILGDNRDAVLQAFVETCPPVDISRIVNGRQFHDFLVKRWQREPPQPSYLPDVAACELACGSVRAGLEERQADASDHEEDAPRGSFRRHSGLVLLRCAYNVRTIFEDGMDAVPAERDTPLAVAMPLNAGEPRVFELMPVVFDVLVTLDEWTDPAVFGDTAEAKELIADLIEHRLVEVRV